MRSVGVLGLALAACGGRVDSMPPPRLDPVELCASAVPLEPKAVLDSGQITTFAISGSGFYWASGGSFEWKTLLNGSPVAHATDRFYIEEVAADDSAGYFTSLGYLTPSGQITRVRSGGALDILATGLIDPAAIAVDQSDIYFVDSGIPSTSTTAGKIWKLSKSGGRPELFVGGLDYPRQLAMSTRYLYWVDATIARADKASGAVEVLFRPPDGLTDFALLEPAVYWINESSVGRFDLDTRQNGVVVSNLFHREGYNDWPEVEANAKAVFVSSVMPSDPSFHGLYMRTLAEGDAGAPLVELDRRVGNRLVVTDRAVFYTRLVADGMTELAMICL